MAYTKEEVNRINAARAANVAAGRDAYSGAGATALSISRGLGGYPAGGEYGAAGRGQEGLEDTAARRAASQLGIPMSDAGKAIGTPEYNESLAYLRSLGTLESSAPTNAAYPVASKSPTSGFSSNRNIGMREPLGFSTEKAVDIKNKADQTFNRLVGQPELNQFGQTSEQEAMGRKAAKELGLPDPFATKPEPKTQESVTFINPQTEQTIKKVNATQQDVSSMKQQGFEVAEADTSKPIELDQDPQVAKLQLEVEAGKKELDTARNELRGSLITDKELRRQTHTIEAAWDARIRDMEEVNNRREAAMKTLGVRLGSRWTGGSGGMFGGIVAAEEREGIRRIAELEAQKQTQITEAQTAAQNKNWQVYAKMIDLAQDSYNKKAEQLVKLQEAAEKKNEEVRKQREQVELDLSVAGLIQENITDPMEILQRINYDDRGNLVGSYDLKRVSESVKALRAPIIDAQNTAYEIALKNGAPAEVLAAISKADTPEEIYAAIGDYSVDKLDREYKKAQIANIYSTIQERKLDSARQNAESKFEPSQIVAYAQQYAATGKIPTGLPKGTFGVVSEVAKELPKQKGELLDKRTGIRPDASDAQVAGYGALYSAIELSKQLKELDEDRAQGLIPAGFGKIFGSKAQSQYMDLRTQIVDLLARARTGAALTKDEEAHYVGMLPGRVGEVAGFIGVDSQVRIDNFTSALSSDLNNKASVQGWAINGVSTVNIDGQEYIVGDVIQNSSGQKGRINADGSVTVIQ